MRGFTASWREEGEGEAQASLVNTFKERDSRVPILRES